MVEIVNVALLIAMLVVTYFVIKIYMVLKEACERRDFPLEGPEMVEEQRAFPVQALEMEAGQRAGHVETDQRRALQRNRETINLRAARNKALPQEHDELR